MHTGIAAENCCGSNAIASGGRLWENRSYPCPHHQESHPPLKHPATFSHTTSNTQVFPSKYERGTLLCRYVDGVLVTGREGVRFGLHYADSKQQLQEDDAEEERRCAKSTAGE